MMHALGHTFTTLSAHSAGALPGVIRGFAVPRAHITEAMDGIAILGVADAARRFSPACSRLFFSAMAKTAGAYATYVQVRLAGPLGCALPRDLSDAQSSLHHLRTAGQPRHADHGSPTRSQGTP